MSGGNGMDTRARLAAALALLFAVNSFIIVLAQSLQARPESSSTVFSVVWTEKTVLF